MKLKIQNIAGIKNAEIEVKDLTVITGKSGSGKTSILKSIEAFVNANDDMGGKVLKDKILFILKEIGYNFNKLEKLDLEKLMEIYEHNLKVKREEILKLQNRIEKIGNEKVEKALADNIFSKIFNAEVSEEGKIENEKSYFKFENDKISDLRISETYFKALKLNFKIEEFYDFFKQKETNSVEMVFNDQKMEKIENLFENVKGRIIPNNDFFKKLVYFENGKKINLENISSSLFKFVLLKFLLEKAILKDDDILIIDDIQNNLDEELQEKMAKIIVSLIVDYKIKVIISCNKNFKKLIHKNAKSFEKVAISEYEIENGTNKQKK
jgi:ABC transporter, ATP-binding protein